MAKKKMIRQLIIPFTLIITISLTILTWYLLSSLKSFYLEETRISLLSKSQIFEPQVKSLMSVMDVDENNISLLQKTCMKVGASSNTRITVILPSGVVLADSENDPKKMDNHNSRDEMKNALLGDIGYSIRHSNTLQRSMMYLATPLEQDGKIIGVLRLSVTTESIDKTLKTLMFKITIAVFIVALFAALIAYFISKRISQPLEKLKEGAERFARGEFELKLPIPDSEEIAQLAEGMNSMASELDKRIKIITQQRNEQKAILQSMIEGVVAVDENEKIIILNQAAGELFEIDSDESKGKSVYEVLRNRELQDVILDTLQSNTHHEGELLLSLKEEKSISYNSSILKGAQGNTIGILLVLNDLTRLKHLESVRQDLVANVSHELRTPITSIKGFVETLSDGAIDDKEDARRFLAIIDKQVDRLNAIIEDLLVLSSIEQNKDSDEVELKDTNVLEVINSAVEICHNKAKSKLITMVIDCDEKLIAKLNAPLMEQAIVNLVDNSIKYSPEGSQTNIRAFVQDKNLEISVEDQGMGIDSKHFPRLFERFYVIDQARSRELGGTGLGLAIVKHIAAANKGIVKVESELGKGSVFSIHVPL